jgi:hypothetical protein
MKNLFKTNCTVFSTKMAGFKKSLTVFAIAVALMGTCQVAFAQDAPEVKPAQTNADYPGGIDKFYSYILSKMTLDRTCIPGKKIYVQFVIEKDGALKHAKIKGKELSEAMNAQLVKIFEATEKWIPAKQNGRVLRTHFTCPVMFMPKADMMAKVDLPQLDQ